MPTQPQTAAPSPDAPTTVGAYVRAKLPEYVRRYALWAAIAGSASAAMQARQYGFSAMTIPAAIAGIVIGAVLLIGIAAIALTIGGWWETRRYRA